jgi:hypothetical protein
MLQTTLAPVNGSVNSPAFLADLEDLMLDGLDSPKEDDLRAGSRNERPAVSHTESALGLLSLGTKSRAARDC